MRERLRIVVSGLIAQYPLGGLTWHYLNYLGGLARMGHDVFYIEHTGGWPYNPVEGGTSPSCDYNVAYLRDALARFGLEDKWAYCFPWDDQWFGLDDDARAEVIETADLVLNVSGVLDRPQDYRRGARLVYIDTDPVFTQIRLAQGRANISSRLAAHDVLFSFGERLAAPVPDTGHRWLPTRQPVVLSEWAGEREPRDVFTTVMNWTSYASVRWDGRSYGQKNRRFRDFAQLPRHVGGERLELAMASGKTTRAPYDRLRRAGWSIVDPADCAGSVDRYRDYILTSKAEWGVAKHAYVAGRPGWFSERSACYLAAGRPVVVEDTGFGATLPVGEGLIPFSDLAGAVDGIRAVERDYERHSRAAREIARTHFDAEIVLGRLLDDALA